MVAAHVVRKTFMNLMKRELKVCTRSAFTRRHPLWNLMKRELKVLLGF